MHIISQPAKHRLCSFW